MCIFREMTSTHGEAFHMMQDQAHRAQSQGLPAHQGGSRLSAILPSLLSTQPCTGLGGQWGPHTLGAKFKGVPTNSI